MAPRRRGRPRKADKPSVDGKPDAGGPSELAGGPGEVAEEDEEAAAEPGPKKAKVEEKKKRGRPPKAASKKLAASVNDVHHEDKADVSSQEAVEVEASNKSDKVVIIEASKECNCFKTRAAIVKTGLTKAIPGIEVLINPDKPRKGCFEVRSKDGDIYMSLLGLPRPFTKLKNYDMDKAVEEIVEKVN